MKIALIGPVYPYRGGIAHYTTMVDRSLHEAGHNVLLVSFSRQYPQWLFPGRSDKDPSELPLRAIAPNYWLDSLNPLTWFSTFGRLYRARPDVLVLQWWTTFWAPVWITLGILNRLFLRRPLVYICHNVLPHETHFWDRWLAKLTLRWGTRFIVQSAAEEKRLRRLLGEVDTRVVPHPVYDFLADQELTKADARRRLNLPDEAPVILFFGIVREYKGLRDLLHALPYLLETFNDARLLVVGEFWEPKETYTALIEQLGIQNAVMIDDRYVPNEEVGAYFVAADLMVAPYRRVTDSGALQMARGFGLPVVKGRAMRDSDTNNNIISEEERVNMLVADMIATLAASQHYARATGELSNNRSGSSWSELVAAIVAPNADQQP